MRLTSSLSGAVDEPVPPSHHPQKTRSLFSPHTQSSWDSQSDGISWPSSYPPDRVTPVYQRQSPEVPPELTYGHAPVQGTSSSTYSPRLLDSPTPSLYPSTFQNQTHFSSGRSPEGISMVLSGHPHHRPPLGSMEEEIRTLRKEKRELELMNERNRLRVNELERELSRCNASTRHTNDPLIPLSVQNTHTSSAMEASLKARTDSRIKLLCSSNRAGNALCSWHDSRRERRAYPPRMAPQGYLNCGCTYEEALFEESLSRHGVGSYRPGETVRMDPTLRRPLLRLLQKRYNYRDGDFERDSETGDWVQGEGHFFWEQKLVSSAPSTRKARNDRR